MFGVRLSKVSVRWLERRLLCLLEEEGHGGNAKGEEQSCVEPVVTGCQSAVVFETTERAFDDIAPFIK